MKQILMISSFLLLTTASFSFSQEIPQDKIQIPSVINSVDDPDNQQINKDEGYGPNDVEYNEAEGEGSQKIPTNSERNYNN